MLTFTKFNNLFQLFATKGNYSSSFGQTDPKTKWIEGVDSPGTESPPGLRVQSPEPGSLSPGVPHHHHLSSSSPSALGVNQHPREALSPPVVRDAPLTPPPRHLVERDTTEEVE